MRAYFLEASFESSSDLAPVTTTLPEAKIRAVVFGSRMRTMAAAKRFRLYSALRAWLATVVRSTWQARSKVATTFWRAGTIPVGEVRGLEAKTEDLAGAVDGEVEALLAAVLALEEGMVGIIVKLTGSLMPSIEKQVYQAER